MRIVRFCENLEGRSDLLTDWNEGWGVKGDLSCFFWIIVRIKCYLLLWGRIGIGGKDKEFRFRYVIFEMFVGYLVGALDR